MTLGAIFFPVAGSARGMMRMKTAKPAWRRTAKRAAVGFVVGISVVVAVETWTIPSQRAAADPVAIENEQGFDSCARPSEANMNTWWSASPYYQLGFYLGGPTVGCSITPSNAYLAYIQSLGWNELPIWAGYLMPTSCGGPGGGAYTITLNNTTAAWNEGVSSAAAARNSFANTWELGAPPAVIYDDMEYFSWNPSQPEGPCELAAINYMGGWDDEMNNLQVTPGIYGQPSSVMAEMVWYVANHTSFIPPYVIWMASYKCGPPGPCYDASATTFNQTYIQPYVPNEYWSTYQRIWQYAGQEGTSSMFEDYGSVRLSIDDDCTDGYTIGESGYLSGSCNVIP